MPGWRRGRSAIQLSSGRPLISPCWQSRAVKPGGGVHYVKRGRWRDAAGERAGRRVHAMTDWAQLACDLPLDVLGRTRRRSGHGTQERETTMGPDSELSCWWFHGFDSNLLPTDAAGKSNLSVRHHHSRRRLECHDANAARSLGER